MSSTFVRRLPRTLHCFIIPLGSEAGNKVFELITIPNCSVLCKSQLFAFQHHDTQDQWMQKRIKMNIAIILMEHDLSKESDILLFWTCSQGMTKCRHNPIGTFLPGELRCCDRCSDHFVWLFLWVFQCQNPWPFVPIT